MKAIYPCSFNPIHNGHIEVIKEAASMYEHLFLLISNNENKFYQNTLSTRMNVVKKAIDSLKIDNITVISQEPGKLTPNIAKELGVKTIVRGVDTRKITKYEETLAESYLELNDDLIINYIVTPLLKITSEDIIKMNKEGKSIKKFVPKIIEKDVILKWS